jgi:Tfp pilus assembly protein PilE
VGINGKNSMVGKNMSQENPKSSWVIRVISYLVGVVGLFLALISLLVIFTGGLFGVCDYLIVACLLVLGLLLMRVTYRVFKKNGFTEMVYLWVSILVIVVLAAIAIPSFIKARNTSAQNACINNLRIIDSGKEQAALANKWAEPNDYRRREMYLASILPSVNLKNYDIFSAIGVGKRKAEHGNWYIQDNVDLVRSDIATNEAIILWAIYYNG